MRKSFALFILLNGLAITNDPMSPVAQAQAVHTQSSESAIEQVLHTQQDAWNRGDLEGFMTGYWKSEKLTFFSGVKESDGWQNALDHYRATYSGPGHEMGKLDFSGLRIEMLGPDAAFVRGAWELTLSDGKKPHGLFTLVFRRIGSDWKIVHDHSASAE